MNNLSFAATWKNILGLTAAGFLGMVVFVMIVIALSPLLLIFGISMLIQKIRFNHMLKKAAREGNISNFSVNVNKTVDDAGNFTKHVEVTVVDESGKVL